MKQVLITERQLHEITSSANAEITNNLVKEGTIDAITGLMLTAHAYNVMATACDHLFNKEKKNV